MTMFNPAHPMATNPCNVVFGVLFAFPLRTVTAAILALSIGILSDPNAASGKLQNATQAGTASSPQSKPWSEVPPSSLVDQAGTGAFDKKMEAEGIVIDRAAGLIAFRGKFSSPKQPLEYLITAPKGSHYESLISIEVRPSYLAAALISMGVEQGKPPVRKAKAVKPTDEELQRGATVYDVEPGSGGGVYIYVEWNDSRGFHRNRLEDLIFERPEGQTLANGKFIFANSMMVPVNPKSETTAYEADLTGNFCTCGFGNGAVLAYVKPHAYAMEGDFEVYQPNWTLVPSEQAGLTVFLSLKEMSAPWMERMAPPPAVKPASAPADGR